MEYNLMSTENMKKNILWTGTIVKAEENIWISLLECNGLVKVDTSTRTAYFVDCFKNEKNEYQLHSQILCYENKLFFVPWNAHNIAIYDLKENIMRQVMEYRCDKSRYSGGVVNGKYLYLVSSDFGRVVQVDMDLEKVIDIYEMNKILDKDLWYLVPPIRINNTILTISEKKDLTWAFDLEKQTYSQWEYMFDFATELIAGCKGCQCIWIIGNDGTLYLLSEKGECKERYDISAIMHQVMGEFKIEFLRCICFHSVLIIIFYDKNCIVKIPLVGNVPDFGNCKYIYFDPAFFPLFLGDYEDLIVMSDDRLVIHNDVEEREILFDFDINFVEDMRIKKGNMIKEIPMYGVDLSRFVNYICDFRGSLLTEYSNVNIDAGKRIYEMTI